MKKIKIISIAITIFAIIFGIGLKVCFSHNKDEQTITENDVVDESKKTEIENEETQPIVEIPVEENIVESNMQNNDIASQAEDDTEKTKNEFASSSKEDSNKSTMSKQNTKSSQKSKKTEIPVTTSKESKTEQKNTSKTETKKTETKTETKQEEKTQIKSEWCFEGGSKHISGDGTNEHGYYDTWNEAFNAYEEYTKNWLSSHYKINQCACGKYYFWAIQD